MRLKQSFKGLVRARRKIPFIFGGPCCVADTLSVPRALFVLLVGLLATAFFLPTEALAQTATGRVTLTAEPTEPADPIDPEPASVSYTYSYLETVEQDSLRSEIRRISRVIASLRDSLNRSTLDLEFTDENRRLVQENIEQFTDIIEGIGQEMGRMDLRINDNQISFVDETGDGIIISVPEHLDEFLGEGLQSVAAQVIHALPDTFEWNDGTFIDLVDFFEEAEEPERQIIHGNIIKIGEDVHVDVTEEVDGAVVVVRGNAHIAGRVDGDVVVILGDLVLDQDAEVTGQVVDVMGRLDQAASAEVGDVVVVNPWRTRSIDGEGRFLSTWLGFLMSQIGFILITVLAMIGLAVVPAERLASIQTSLHTYVGPAFGIGLLATFAGSAVALVLIAVLVLTVIGIPVALLVALALALLAVFASGIVALALGQWCCRRIAWKCGSNMVQVCIGLLLIHAVSFVGSVINLNEGMAIQANVVLASGAILKLGVFLLGLGALIHSRFGTRFRNEC